MHRRAFLKASCALPTMAMMATLPRFARAETDTAGKWRVFEVTPQVEILQPVGVTRAWLPIPLTEDTPYQKGMGNTWKADGATVSTAQDPKFGAAFVFAEWPEAVQKPMLELTSRVATRDHTVDLDKPGSMPKVDPKILTLYTGPTDLLPTDGIVLETAQKIVKGVRGGHVAQARAIYEWVVESTFRDPKTRGCGLGDIKTMLETNNMGGKCADLNAMFVGLCRAVGIPARDVYGVRVATSQRGFKSLGRSGDITKAQHCRAEFYAEGHGWVPVDPADVRKVILEEQPGLTLQDEIVERARALLFGNWEMNWMAYNFAHDVALRGSARKPLGYFMYPQG
ncbi:MAG TPA: transglutaminase family protein, partial [Candidatus Saccharimonadia bacterium]|nr:transglutaminase family protein [Candidatus Saccharimonadia bacterium]